MTRVHCLKTWPDPYAEVARDNKTFEIRSSADRDFAVGDVLVLQEFVPETARYTGEMVSRRVTYIARGPEWGIPAGMVVMSLAKLEAAEAARKGG